jgi:hypothetical protein
LNTFEILITLRTIKHSVLSLGYVHLGQDSFLTSMNWQVTQGSAILPQEKGFRF